MNVQQFLQDSTNILTRASLNSARLDVLILMEDVLEVDRSSLLAHPEMDISDSKITKLNNFVTQREKHIPLAYIRGRVPFYGRDFTVNSCVLVPRPETEAIIELLQKITFSKPPVIADIGTGSGCIGVTAALESPGCIVHFYDTDQRALDMAEVNAARHDVSGHYFLGNVLSQWHSNYDVVLANLPYVPDTYPINTAAGFEPKLALFSGSDGLDHYRLLWKQISSHTTPPRHVIIESLPQQHQELHSLANHAGYRLHATHEYVQHFRKIQTPYGTRARS